VHRRVQPAQTMEYHLALQSLTALDLDGNLLAMQNELNANLANLSLQFPSVVDAVAEVVALEAELNLPKKAEHYMSDIHGEFDRLDQILRAGSGVIGFAIDHLFPGELIEENKKRLISIICFPELSLKNKWLENDSSEKKIASDYLHLIKVAAFFSRQHPKNHVRSLLVGGFSSIIEELIYISDNSDDTYSYQEDVLKLLVEYGFITNFLVSLSDFIRNVSAAKLHVIGDIFDRGQKAEKVMDALIVYKNVDVQWGNHDIIWMGAASGSAACIANVVRVSLRYGNTETLEQGYGISLRKLASFGLTHYSHDPCTRFIPKLGYGRHLPEEEVNVIAKMHKAITIIQLKLEGQIINNRPQYKMDDRLLLDKINFEKNTVEVDGASYSLADCSFPTLESEDPYKLTTDEESLVNDLLGFFVNSERLQKHAAFLFSHGSMYLTSNQYLLYHGCIPMNKDGTFMDFVIDGQTYSGKPFLDRTEFVVRQGVNRQSTDEERKYSQDSMWYLWNGAQSPLFGKEKMATFESYFIDDKKAQYETRNAYYDFRNDEEAVKKILVEFGLSSKKGRIVNGHVPVKAIKGESPVKAGGKLLVIDGGFSDSYQSQTGVGGYTLVSDTNGVFLVAHNTNAEMHYSKNDIIMESDIQCLEAFERRVRVRDSDEGELIKHRIHLLLSLIDHYQEGSTR
jgi:fructose-1,6-bisphosphatase-3